MLDNRLHHQIYSCRPPAPSRYLRQRSTAGQQRRLIHRLKISFVGAEQQLPSWLIPTYVHNNEGIFDVRGSFFNAQNPSRHGPVHEAEFQIGWHPVWCSPPPIFPGACRPFTFQSFHKPGRSKLRLELSGPVTHLSSNDKTAGACVPSAWI